jgi:hypothetical protein
MSLQTAVDVWTARYIKSREASLARLMGALSPPDKQRQRDRYFGGGHRRCKKAPSRLVAFGLKAEGAKA